ncbi:hypothetical protein D3C71_1138040 [compost metagenome]
MVAFGSLVPLRRGKVSSVVCPLLSGPVTVPTSSRAWVITGASGATVSTITVKPGDATLTLPAASVAVAVQVWLPLLRAVGGVKLHAPDPLAVTVPTCTPFS